MAEIIDGVKLANKWHVCLQREVMDLRARNVSPTLAIVLVGQDPASEVYVRAKIKACSKVGIKARLLALDASISQQALLKQIQSLNSDPQVHGILVQLPLPSHISQEQIVSAIAWEKDVDGLNPYNLGRLMMGDTVFVPCTPQGILQLLLELPYDLEGKHAVVVGRSLIVGKPLGILLQQHNATVTLCHSKTKDLIQHTRQADLLVVAVGRPKLITGEYVKPGAVVIDVGITRLDCGQVVGDVDFDDVFPYVEAISPVPGGVGPMTVAMLLANVVKAAQRRLDLHPKR